MKRSFFMAFAVALAAFAWVASGRFTNVEGNTGQDAKTAAVASQAAGEAPARVRTSRSVARDHERWQVLFGRTEGVRSVQIKVETTGRLVAVPGVKGESVKKGQVIARLDLADRKARLVEAEASLERYVIAFEAALKLSQKQFRSKVQLAGARADLAMAEARLRTIRVDIERTTVRAPFDGVLDEIPVAVGDFVEIGNVVATVIDLDPILVVGEVTERSVNRLVAGARAIVTPVGSEAMEGIVRYVSKVASAATRTFRVEVTLANPAGVIAEGLTTEMRLEQGRIKAHFLSPAVLTLNDRGELGVKVVDGDDVVRFYGVTIIDDTPQGIWLTGLPETAMVIVVGQEFVNSGQTVEGVEVAAEEPS